MEEEPFAALLRKAGIQRAYHDGLGTYRVASDDSCLAALRCLGFPLHRIEEANQVLRDLRPSVPIAPFTGGWEGDPVRVEVQAAPGPAHLHLTGTAMSSRVQPIGDEGGEPRADGSVRRSVDLGILPVGRYGLRLEEASGVTTVGRLVVAPKRGFRRAERRFGVFLPLYSAWSAERPHADYRHLNDLRRWVAGAGGSFVGTLPLFPTFLDRPFDPSPYAPVTRRFFSELYLDLESLVDSGEQRGRGELGSPTGDDRAIDYRSWWGAKRPRLSVAADRFFSRGAPGLDAFVERVPDAIDYARFRSALARSGAAPAPTSVDPARSLTIDEAQDPEIRFHLYCQMHAYAQLSTSDAAPGLYLDFPLGVHGGGYDAWRHGERFVQGLGVGAPPDPLFSQGQSWGFAPLHPERLFDRHVEYLDGCLARVMALADVLRVDHVMGLHRVYCIPHGFDATDGLYLSQPSNELYAMFNLASHEHQTELVGEDLGTVPDEVRHTLAERSWRRMYVLPFHIRHDHVESPSPDSLACLNTHDMAPFAGFLEGRDLQILIDLGFSLPGGNEHALGQRGHDIDTLCRIWNVDRSAAPLLEAAVRFLADSDSSLVLLSLEDLWLETVSQNVPGTSTEYPNWRQRARCPIDTLPEDVNRVLEFLGQSKPR